MLSETDVEFINLMSEDVWHYREVQLQADLSAINSSAMCPVFGHLRVADPRIRIVLIREDILVNANKMRTKK